MDVSIFVVRNVFYKHFQTTYLSEFVLRLLFLFYTDCVLDAYTLRWKRMELSQRASKSMIRESGLVEFLRNIPKDRGKVAKNFILTQELSLKRDLPRMSSKATNLKKIKLCSKQFLEHFSS